MKLFLFTLGLCLITLINCNNVRKNKTILAEEEDIYRNVSELISSKGYPVEEHIVQTEDGYLLAVQRIPNGKQMAHSAGHRPAILIEHGLLSSSSDWVINFPKQSLGFILADHGYDVWLGNARGNVYSRHHIKLEPNMSEFWDFSFDQMGEYDLPAMIDYVLNKTEQKQLFYIGHSQGTTAAFALLSENPHYNKKIKLFIALAPVASVGYITNFIRYLSPFAINFDWFLKLMGLNEFLPSFEIYKYISDKVCEGELKATCDIIYWVYGYKSKEMNETRYPVYLGHFPQGASTKCILHYAQLVESKKFAKFDYGSQNMAHYNQSTPPDYDVSKITTPIALLWALEDNLADKIDVGFLERRLKSTILSYCVPDIDFTHGDFVYGVKAHELVYNVVLSLLQKYT